MLRWVALFILIANTSWAAIGEVAQINGSGQIKRDSDTIDGAQGVGLEMMDTVSTAQGNMQLNFIDDTRVDVTEHSKLVIDEFIYDPNTNTGKLSLNATLGAVRYASGQIAKNSRQNVNINTPSAKITVRGTDFMMIVDEIGGSMITLLPSCNDAGLCVVGEINVETDIGMVVMNQAFQTTVVASRLTAPAKPVILELPEDQLRSMLIVRRVSPYKQVADAALPVVDVLGFDFLDYNALDEDQLSESIKTIWVTDLDNTTYLRSAFVDVLDQMMQEALAAILDELQGQNTAFFEEKILGLDPETNLFHDEVSPNYIINRADGGDTFFQLKLSQESGYVLSMTQGDFNASGYRVGVGTNNISISQSE